MKEEEVADARLTIENPSSHSVCFVIDTTPNPTSGV